jgi:hypothetical protein
MAGKALATVLSLLVLIGSMRLVTVADRRLATLLDQAPEAAELIYAPPAGFLKLISLRYEHALANVLWFRTINYFGKHYRDDRTYPWLAEMCDRVTDLDPRGLHVYRFGGVILPWEANRIDEGIALLEKGARNMPDSWEIHYMLGFSHYFFRDDLAAASRELRAAIAQPNAPTFLLNLLTVIDTAERGPQSAVAFLEATVERAETPEVREAIREQIAGLILTSDLETLQSAVNRFRSRLGRLPESLFELVVYGFVPFLPPEPRGGFLLHPETGEVMSAMGRAPKRLGSSAKRESFLRRARTE